MTSPAILVFSGSTRAGSYNGRLADLAHAELVRIGATAKRITLKDFPLPVYDGDVEKESGVPEAALAFRAELDAHAGLFIACPEYNSGYTPLLKNTLDWASRGLSKPLLAGKIVAIGGASPSWRGALRGLIATRTLLELGYGAMLTPDMVFVTHADKAYDENGAFLDAAMKKQLATAAATLLREVRKTA